MGNLERTSASEWRKGGELVQLPSGKVAELKRLSVITLIKQKNTLPNFLLNKLEEGLSGFQKPKKAKDTQSNTDEAFEAMVWMTKACFVYPKVVDGEPEDDDEISIEDIDLDDMMYVMNYGIGELGLTTTLERFHDEQNGHVEPVPASADVDDSTE